MCVTLYLLCAPLAKITDADPKDNHTLVVVDISLSPAQLNAQFQFRESASDAWLDVDHVSFSRDNLAVKMSRREQWPALTFT